MKIDVTAVCGGNGLVWGRAVYSLKCAHLSLILSVSVCASLPFGFQGGM